MGVHFPFFLNSVSLVFVLNEKETETEELTSVYSRCLPVIFEMSFTWVGLLKFSLCDVCGLNNVLIKN